MVFKPGIPQPNDLLSDSQGDLLGNMQQLDTSFGIDHYKFSDTTANLGFHNQVTTPQFVLSPAVLPSVEPTTTTNPIFYGYQPLDVGGMPITKLGLLQYSKLPSNGIPTPVTHLQSTAAALSLAINGNAGDSTNILDFTGIPRAFCMVYASYIIGGVPTNAVYFVFWSGTTFLISPIVSTASRIVVAAVGNVLVLANLNTGNAISALYWTMQMDRLE